MGPGPTHISFGTIGYQVAPLPTICHNIPATDARPTIAPPTLAQNFPLGLCGLSSRSVEPTWLVPTGRCSQPPGGRARAQPPGPPGWPARLRAARRRSTGQHESP
jgi:hypothetical protein